MIIVNGKTYELVNKGLTTNSDCNKCADAADPSRMLCGTLPFACLNGGYYQEVTDVSSRTLDKATSKAAAAKVKKVSISDTIIDLLIKYPSGLTGQEIAERSGYRLNSVTPRFANLVRTNKIVCNHFVPTRSGQTVWVLA